MWMSTLVLVSSGKKGWILHKMKILYWNNTPYQMIDNPNTAIQELQHANLQTETSTASTLLFSIDGLDCFTTWFDEVISCSNVCRQYTCGYASFWWAFHCIVLRILCPKHDMAINRVTNNQKIWQGIKFGKFGRLPPFATAWFQMIACRDVSGFIRSSFRWESGSIMDVTVTGPRR